MLDNLAFGAAGARSLPARGYSALMKRDTNNIKSQTAVGIQKSTLAALIVAAIAILVVLGVSLWFVLRYTCTREGRKKGMQVSDDRDVFGKEGAKKDNVELDTKVEGGANTPKVEVTPPSNCCRSTGGMKEKTGYEYREGTIASTEQRASLRVE
ncbi:hypothetical protein BDZ85DRAFT_246418 [Elsinoe ampelina]|uniref:Uncharacterized protein n=1 Tax=Elsinoe ampelina TaxID=302913 RepID=A0A6A6GQW0_9PEZI|nr:hypothetical protein BDZ85DRAFT_246418 [Elsinoe ampelina]